MKQTLLFFLFLLTFSLQMKAQDFTFDYLSEDNTSFQLSGEFDQSVIIKGMVTNQSSNNIDITWIREEVYLSDNWQTAVCDKERCYLTWVSSESFSLSPGESGTLDAYLYPRNQPGDSAIVNIKLVSSANPTDTTVVSYYFYQEISSSTQDDASNGQLVIYPNPASTYFKVSSDRIIGSVEVFDILGKELRAVYPRSTEAYVDVIGLFKGIYIVRVKDTNGKILKTQRLRKEMP